MILTINQGTSYESVSVIGKNSSCSDPQCARLCMFMPIKAPSWHPTTSNLNLQGKLSRKYVHQPVMCQRGRSNVNTDANLLPTWT